MGRKISLFRTLGCATMAALCSATPFSPAYADLPLSYLHGDGSKAYPVVWLTWGLLAISIIVTLIVCTLLVWGIVTKRARNDDIAATTIGRSGGGMNWLVWGTGISTIALFGSLVWTVAVLVQKDVDWKFIGLEVSRTWCVVQKGRLALGR